MAVGSVMKTNASGGSWFFIPLSYNSFLSLRLFLASFWLFFARFKLFFESFCLFWRYESRFLEFSSIFCVASDSKLFIATVKS